MQRLEVSGAVRHIYASLGFKGLNSSSDSILFAFVIEIITYYLYSKRFVCYFILKFLIYFISFPNISLCYFAHRNAECSSPHPLRAKHKASRPIKHRQNKLLITSYTRVPTKPSSSPSCSRNVVVCFLLGNSQAFEFYIPTFRNTLSVPSS